MFQLNQTVLLIVIIVLTTLLSIIAFQIILILKEVRQLLKRGNGLIDQSENILQNFAHPAQSLTGLVAGLKDGVNLIENISSFFQKHRHQREFDTYEPELP